MAASTQGWFEVMSLSKFVDTLAKLSSENSVKNPTWQMSTAARSTKFLSEFELLDRAMAARAVRR